MAATQVKSVLVDVPPFSRIYPEQFQMTRNGNSDSWSLTVELPAASRFAYSFVQTFENGDVIRRGELEDLGKLRSVIATRNASPSFNATLPENAPRGTVNYLTIASEVLGQNRNLTVYRSPDLGNSEPDKVLIFFDRDIYFNEAGVADILDHLNFNGSLARTTAVFIEQVEREKELVLNPHFASFVTDELIKEFRGQENFIIGASFGGLCALYTVTSKPDAFAGVIAQSPSLWRCQEHLSKLTPPSGSYRTYIDWGLFEVETRNGINLRDANRQFSTELISLGHDIGHHEYRGGHGAANWRETLPAALEFITTKQK